MLKFCNKCVLFGRINKSIFTIQTKVLITSNDILKFDSKRYYSAPKRFYKSVNILCNDDGNYEIALDHKKLRTTGGNPLKINNQALTLAVAAEWDAQKDKIQKGTMYLTALCSFLIDNPSNITKSEIINNILNSLDTDTVLFYAQGNDDLYEMQQTEWMPIIDWFNNEFSINIQPTTGIHVGIMDSCLKERLQRYLESFEFPVVYGISCIVDTLKSFILTTACVKRFITVEKAVCLSRLEEEYQSKKWGKVEWSHNMNEADALARTSSAVLFIHLNCSEESSIVKKKFNS